MDIAKFFAAILIGIFLSSFLGQFVSLVYPLPKMNEETGPVNVLYSNNCSKMIKNRCGDYTSYKNYTEYSKCSTEVVTSEEYKKCNEQALERYQQTRNNYTKRVQTYQLINTIIYGILGIIFILLGFLLIDKKSIGIGILFGGSLLVLFGGVFSLLNAMGSTFTTLVGGSKESGIQTAIKVIQLIVTGIVLLLMIILSYFRLEKEGNTAFQEQ